MVDWKDEDNFKSRNWMTGDVNAAVAGAFEGGATEVLVRDAHGPAKNIVPEDLDPRAELCRGWGVTGMMFESFTSDFDVLMLVGYHSKADTEGGVMCHSWSGIIRDFSVGGVSMGEAGLSALAAGMAGAPLVMVSGDDKLAVEVQALVPGVKCAVVKYGIRRLAGRCLPLEKARAIIRETAKDAVSNPGSKPFTMEFPTRAELRFSEFEMALSASKMPGTERSGQFSVAAEVADFDELVAWFSCAHKLARA